MILKPETTNLWLFYETMYGLIWYNNRRTKNTFYEKKNRTVHHRWMSNLENYYDKIIDGLRVSSSTEFS